MCGLMLMKVLAWKRWKSGVLHVKLRLRLKRRLFKAWRRFVQDRTSFLNLRVLRRFFLSFKSRSSQLGARRRRDAELTSQVHHLQKRLLFSCIRLSFKIVNFSNTRSLFFRVSSCLRRWHVAGSAFAALSSRLSAWQALSLDPETCSSVAAVLYRHLLRTVKLRKGQAGLVWAGTLASQVCFLAFSALKKWFSQKLVRKRLNKLALEHWRFSVLRSLLSAWRLVRFFREASEASNASALHLWSSTLLGKSFSAWRARSAEFKGERLEAAFHAMRAGFATFVRATCRRKYERATSLAAERLAEARAVALLRAAFLAWARDAAFEAMDRRMREKRDGKKRVMLKAFCTWKIEVRARVVARLVHEHHGVGLVGGSDDRDEEE